MSIANRFTKLVESVVNTSEPEQAPEPALAEPDWWDDAAWRAIKEARDHEEPALAEPDWWDDAAWRAIKEARDHEEAAEHAAELRWEGRAAVEQEAAERHWEEGEQSAPSWS